MSHKNIKKSKTTAKQWVGLIGSIEKTIKRIPHIVCFRKPLDIRRTKIIMSRYQTALGMVSAHNIYRKPNTPYCKAWCHCFRDPDKYLGNKPKILLSESDFIDHKNILVLPRKRSKWNFFYFTVGGNLGIEYKGMDIFVRSLPLLCGKYKMKGLVVIYAYGKQTVPLSQEEKEIFEKYRGRLTINDRHRGPLRVAKIMAGCQFGFFPNRKDCSPLLLTESIVRGCPVLVYEEILGGWKYADGKMGLSFNLDNLEDQIKSLISTNYNPYSAYLTQYGYKNTSMKLAKFMNKHYGIEFSMIGFNGTQKNMAKELKELK